MMSIEVENNSEHGAKFKVTQLDVDVTNAVVTPLDSAELTKVIWARPWNMPEFEPRLNLTPVCLCDIAADSTALCGPRHLPLLYLTVGQPRMECR